MKVVSYLNSVPSKNNNNQKTDLLKKYIQGVNAAGDTGIVHAGNEIVPADVGMIQGWVYEKKSTPHLRLRDTVINTQKNNKQYVCTADANLFLYADKKNTHGYLRYSYNGVFPNTGIYCDDKVNANRWNIISRDTGIQLDNYKTRGKWVLLMLQRNGGWSMNGLDVQQWAVDTINQIKKHTDRTILIRPHPGDKQAMRYLAHHRSPLKNIKNVKISNQGTSLEQDLSGAWAVVNHNSSAVVGPIIQGYNCFITDPISSQCAEVAHTDFSQIETPRQFDRQRWLERISMFHWKFSELEDGTCWRHMRDYCQ